MECPNEGCAPVTWQRLDMITNNRNENHSRQDGRVTHVNIKIPLSIMTSIHPALRDSFCFSLVMDSPDVVVLRHDINPETGQIRRVIVDSTGVIEDVSFELEHTCLSCAVREDAVPTLGALAAAGKWSGLVLALPVSADSSSVAWTLSHECTRTGRLPNIRLTAVSTIVDPHTLVEDLLGTDLLDERGLALTADDERAVGEALAAQISHADAIVLSDCSAGCDVGRDLIEHLRADDAVVHPEAFEVTPQQLLAHMHDAEAAFRRVHPLYQASRLTHSETGVWTLELHSPRPMHPQRLLDHIERLGNRPVRSRGHFWVPSRPQQVCHWDGAGGQLSIGSFEDDEFHESASTRLIFTGIGDWHGELVQAFNDVLVTEEELSSATPAWGVGSDGLEPWLGPIYQ